MREIHSATTCKAARGSEPRASASRSEPRVQQASLDRRDAISSGYTAELLGMDRVAFIQHSSYFGIRFFNMATEVSVPDLELEL